MKWTLVGVMAYARVAALSKTVPRLSRKMPYAEGAAAQIGVSHPPQVGRSHRKQRRATPDVHILLQEARLKRTDAVRERPCDPTASLHDFLLPQCMAVVDRFLRSQAAMLVKISRRPVIR